MSSVAPHFTSTWKFLPLQALSLGFIYSMGLVLMWGCTLTGTANFHVFILLFFATLLINPPKSVLSPLNILYGYYGVWYILAPLIAIRYRYVLDQQEYLYAFSMLYTVFGLGVLSIKYGEKLGFNLTPAPTNTTSRAQRRISDPSILSRSLAKLGIMTYLPFAILGLYILSTIFVYLIIQASGGFNVWIQNPGAAFLHRAGSGMYVILSHYSSTMLAALSGYYAYKKRALSYLLSFIVWLMITSPVHGSKLQISLLLIMLLLPWLRRFKFLQPKSLLLYLTLISIFFLGLYYRGLHWVSFSTTIHHSLNYFSALDNLAVSIRDFDPGFLTTFFLPFVKFKTLFGLKDPSMYFDMNHMLTDYYYPAAWAIRATQQWPVETDLYLNFYFFLGLPLVAFYLGCTAFFYGHAAKKDTLGAWVAAFLLTLFIVSHLRGSLINHVDFYMYPYIIALYFLFNKMSMSHNEIL